MNSNPNKSDETQNQILDLYRKLLFAWNQRDASRMASLFSENGDVIGFDGSYMKGPGEIVSILGQIFADHKTAAFVGIVREIRLLNSDSGILRAVVSMVPEGGSDINPAVNALQTVFATREKGEWKIELFQNTPAAYHGRPEAVEELSNELRSAFRISSAEPK